MLKTRKRWISLLLTLAMLVAFAVPFVGSAYAGTAATYNQVTTIPTFDPKDTSASDQETAVVQAKFDPAVSTLSQVDFEVLDGSGAPLKIKNYYDLSVSGLVYSGSDAYSIEPVNPDTNGYSKKWHISCKPAAGVDKAWVNFGLIVDAKNCASGDVKINFFNAKGQFSAGSVVVANAGGGAVTLAVVGTPPSLSSDGGNAEVTLRLDVKTDGALEGVKIKLPAGFKWDASDDRTLEIGPDGDVNIDDTVAGIYDITAEFYVDDSDTAKYGDVVASVTGVGSTKVSPSTVTVGTYGEYAVDITVDSVETLLAGKYDQQTDLITIKEKVPGTLVDGRKITVKFPDWVHVEDIDDGKDCDNCSIDVSTIDGTSNKFTVTVSDLTKTDKAEIEFKANLSIEAGYTGDLEATVSGAGIPESKVVVAKVVAPVTAAATPTNVKIGLQDQAAPDITLTEAVEEAAASTYYKWNGTDGTETGGTNGQIEITLPSGVHFSGTPVATVTSGDLDIKDAKVDDSDNGTNDMLVIPIKSESATASTIKITGVKLTLDRTVPEGPLTAKVGGKAVVENNGTEDYQFNTSAAAKFTLANVMGELANVVFKIGEASYTVNGVTVAMDVAPYIKDGRTFLPVRYAGNAFSVNDANIMWDDAAKKATLIKGDRVIQFTIGSNVMTINGAVVTMDAAPEIVSGRVMVPIRFLGQALGASFTFDETTQTVTANY